jgi:protein-tyrosine phosphatase
MTVTANISVVFLCLGNHCRSPAAEAVATSFAQKLGLDSTLRGIRLQSRGTNRDHIGQAAHALTIAEGEARGFGLRSHRGKRLSEADFAAAWIVCMDQNNVADAKVLVRDMRPESVKAAFGNQIRLIRDWDTQAQGQGLDDPWGHPAQAYKTMYDTIERCMAALLGELQGSLARLALSG